MGTEEDSSQVSLELERQTRSQRIDPKLKAAGWHVVLFVSGKPFADYGNQAAITEFETEAGPADYALWDHSEALGVVEAKKVTLGRQGVLTQAERYSRGFTANPIDYGDGFRVPFLYSTNGEVIWFHDIRNSLNRSRRISAFHTPAALREMLDRDSAAELKALEALPANPYLRPYQHEANEGIEGAIRNRKRKMLVAMATGTGKTVTLVNEVYRLMKSGVARRVLFLVDRRALAAQAVRTFTSFEAEPGLKFDKIYEHYSQRFFRDDLDDDRAFDPRVIPTGYLTDPQIGQAFVYVSTIKRMTINLYGRDAAFSIGDEAVDEDAEKLDIPIHAFDLIIADECHRGTPRRSSPPGAGRLITSTASRLASPRRRRPTRWPTSSRSPTATTTSAPSRRLLAVLAWARERALIAQEEGPGLGGPGPFFVFASSASSSSGSLPSRDRDVRPREAGEGKRVTPAV